MDLSKVTIQDCVDFFEKKGKCAVLNDGKFIEFMEEREGDKIKWRFVNVAKKIAITVNWLTVFVLNAGRKKKPGNG